MSNCNYIVQRTKSDINQQQICQSKGLGNKGFTLQTPVSVLQQGVKHSNTKQDPDPNKKQVCFQRFADYYICNLTVRSNKI